MNPTDEMMKAKAAALKAAFGICALEEPELFVRLEKLYWDGFDAGKEFQKGQP